MLTSHCCLQAVHAGPLLQQMQCALEAVFREKQSLQHGGGLVMVLYLSMEALHTGDVSWIPCNAFNAEIPWAVILK